MRIPDCVMADLRAQFSSEEISVWIIAWEYLPECVALLASIGKIPVRRAYDICAKMTVLGWMIMQGHSRKLRPTAIIPHATQEKMVLILQEEYEASPNKGEFLVKRYFDLAVHSENFIDNARLEILKNTTGEPLELDRYYRERVGIEYGGPQHFGPTDRFPDAKAALEQQIRDTRKVWLCEKAGITLVRIYTPDLHPRIMSRLIPPSLQRNYVDEEGAYFKALCNLCVSYIARATRVDIQQIMTGRPSE